MPDFVDPEVVLIYFGRFISLKRYQQQDVIKFLIHRGAKIFSTK